MNNEQLPVIAELHDAPDDRARAAIVLRLSDAMVLKHHRALERAVDGFVPAERHFALRVALMQAVRNTHGNLPSGLQTELEHVRVLLVDIAHAELDSPEWPLDATQPLNSAQGPPSLDI